MRARRETVRGRSRALVRLTLLVAVVASAQVGAAPSPQARGILQTLKGVWKKTPRVVKTAGMVGMGMGLTAVGLHQLGVDPHTALDQMRHFFSNGEVQIAGATAAAGGIATRLLYTRGKRAVAAFEQSAGAQQLTQIDTLKAGQSIEGLTRILDQSRASAEQLSQTRTQAKTSGKKRLGDQSLRDLDRQIAFHGLAEARALMALNEISSDPKQRLGGVTLHEWNGVLSRLETEAAKHGFEGHLALKLRDLEAELATEAVATEHIEKRIASMEAHTPIVFTGGMQAHSDAATKQLESFKAGEVAGQRKLLGNMVGAMRERVSQRLRHANGEFNHRSELKAQLELLESGPLRSAMELAEGIKHDLETVVQARLTERYLLDNATGNKNNFDRLAAESQATRAREATLSARTGLEALKTRLAEIRSNPAAQTVRLSELPTELHGGPAMGNGPGLDIVIPTLAAWNSSGMVFDAQTALEKFAPTIDKLRNTQRVARDRVSNESAWLNAQIDRAIEHDAGQAATRASAR